jgi:response regulator RpfG family c-di-GMP phosphodiesterase
VELPRIIIVDDETEITEIIAFYIQSEFQADILELHSGNAAIKQLSVDTSWDLIISDFNMPQGNGLVLFQYLMRHNIPIPFLLATSDRWEAHSEFHNFKLTQYIEKPFDVPPLMDKIYQLFHEKGNLHLEAQSRPNYIALSTHILHEIFDINVPLFVKLSADKYIKILNSETRFDQLIFAKFKLKGINNLYVEARSFQILTEKFSKKAFNNFYFKSYNSESHQAFQLSQATESMIHKSVDYFGLSEDVVKLAQSAIRVVQNIVSRTPNLKIFLRWISDSKYGYEQMRATLVCYLASALYQKGLLTSENALENLSLAAYFQNCSLSAYHIENEYRFREALKLNVAFNRDDLEIINKHPQMSAEILSRIGRIPVEVLNMIESHCERLDGQGFPAGIYAKDFNELTACLVFCEDLAFQFLKSQAQFPDYFKAAKNYYAQTPFQNYYRAFDELFTNSDQLKIT